MRDFANLPPRRSTREQRGPIIRTLLRKVRNASLHGVENLFTPTNGHFYRSNSSRDTNGCARPVVTVGAIEAQRQFPQEPERFTGPAHDFPKAPWEDCRVHDSPGRTP